MLRTRPARPLAAAALVALAVVAARPAAQGAPTVPPTLRGVIIALDRAHIGRVGRHDYTLSERGGRLAAVFTPLPLLDEPDVIRAAASHLVRVAFGETLDRTAPREEPRDGVPALAFPAGARTFLAVPVHNERGLVHGLLIWVEPS